VTFDVLDVVQLWGEGIGDVNDDDLPVGFTLIEEGHDTENLDLLDLASKTDLFTNLANVERIVIALGLGFGVRVVGIFPGLEGCHYLRKTWVNARDVTNLRKGTVVPDVAVVGEAVANETQTTLLDVLLDGIEWFFLGYLEFGVGPAGDLDNHVEDTIALVGKERNVVEGGDDGSVLFWIYTMFWQELVNQLATDIREIVRNVPKVWGAPTTRVENSAEGDEVAQTERRGRGETHGRPWGRRRRDER